MWIIGSGKKKSSGWPDEISASVDFIRFGWWSNLIDFRRGLVERHLHSHWIGSTSSIQLVLSTKSNRFALNLSLDHRTDHSRTGVSIHWSWNYYFLIVLWLHLLNGRTWELIIQFKKNDIDWFEKLIWGAMRLLTILVNSQYAVQIEWMKSCGWSNVEQFANVGYSRSTEYTQF